MDNDRTLAPTGDGSAEPKRTWAPPAVQHMGSMRELTLLQGPSGGGECSPLEDPTCP